MPSGPRIRIEKPTADTILKKIQHFKIQHREHQRGDGASL
jgi:hypothetical protein